MSIPRSEYPRPQFQRKKWLCLNGEWQFEIDEADTGLERGLKTRDLEQHITVPFCPESKLSGIEHTDFMRAVWYRKEVEIPSEWIGMDILLHFQAVDYDTTVWVNGIEVKRHRGGFTPFSCHLKGIAAPGKIATIVVRARDAEGEPKPGGKQSLKKDNYGCFYTRTTGIWQTVWMEPVPAVYLERPRITPDAGGRRFIIEQPVSRNAEGYEVRYSLSYEDELILIEHAPSDADFCSHAVIHIPDDHIHLWEPGRPRLYDLQIELLDKGGKVVDAASSYCGLRSVTIDGMAVKINGKPVFQRQVLDQGYYSDGIMTAPSDAALKKDIELSMAAGFNSARLHQKVFEERFLYHADQMGYLVWGEFGDWGMWGIDETYDPLKQQPYAAIVTQWLEALERDYSHPSIIGWCGLNETPQREIGDEIEALDDLERGMFLAAKAMDRTRPVLDASGYAHRIPEADIYDCHDYTQDPVKLFENHTGLTVGKPWMNGDNINVPYRGQPFFVSEFGGIKWNPEFEGEGDAQTSWGYGDPPKSVEEFYERFAGQCGVLMDNPDMFGFCYTQLTDVFQEQNGIYYFDRSEKFDMPRIREILQRPAAIEQKH